MLTTHQEKALDFSRHISLTANAGSGKTFVLSKRFVEIALQDNVRLRNIAAITFTERAAGELYKKISVEIEKRLSSEKDEKIISKLTRIRRQLVSANISTIHSFCIDILKEFSPEAGLDANFIPIDKTTADEMTGVIIDEFISKRLRTESGGEEIKYLIRILKSKNNLLRQFQSLIEKRKEIEKIRSTLYEGTEEEVAELFREKFEEEFRKIFFPKLKKLNECISAINEKSLVDKPDNKYALEIEAGLRSLRNEEDIYSAIKMYGEIGKELLASGKTVRKRSFLTNDSCASLSDEINFVEEFFAEFNRIKFDEDYSEAELELARFGKIFIKNILEMTHIYQQKKISKGYLDFEDILIFTQKIIGIPEVREYLGNKFKFIMVDEYQDTNEIQYEIFMPVLDYLKRNNFFVVGDEKQSIYMFRKAELEIFDRTKKDMSSGELAGSILQLPHSFRMSPKIAAFVNFTFKNIFKEADIKFNEVGYSEIICAGKENEKSRVEILLADKEAGIEEADLTAAKIIELLEENPELNFSDAAILCRKRNSFLELESALIKYEIPYLIIGGKGFYQRQIIYDIKNYLSFLINKNDDASLVGILRSPFFHLTDTKIYEISLENGISFYQKLNKYSEKDDGIKDIIDLINENSTLASKGDITFLIRKILNETGYWSVIASKINSNQELANLNKALNLANRFSQESFKTLYDYVEFLSESIGTADDESQAQVSSDENAVRIMTIHQSKGLEFKAVFLFNAGATGQSGAVKTLDVEVDKNFGILTKVPVNENYFDKYPDTPIVSIYNYIKNKKSVAELKRLFYVGATRAEEFLFISANPKVNHKDSFLGLLKDGLKITGDEEKINLESELNRLDTETMETSVVKMNYSIPVVRKHEKIKNTFHKKREVSHPEKIAVEKIEDYPEREIISATKIAVFNQCPVKYELTYELGYSKLLGLLKKKEPEADFNAREDKEVIEAPDLKGSVIHSILQEETGEENLDKALDGLLKNQYFDKSEKLSDPEKFSTDIKNDLQNLYSSSFFKRIKECKNYKNEFELYTLEGEYFLYGIVDKLIIEDEKVLILDYKTDNIRETEIDEESKKYADQLHFYSFIVKKLFPAKKVETILLFVKHPEKPVIKGVSEIELNIFGGKLKNDIEKIHLKKFEVNLNHCKHCQFFERGKCLKSVNSSKN